MSRPEENADQRGLSPGTSKTGGTKSGRWRVGGLALLLLGLFWWWQGEAGGAGPMAGETPALLGRGPKVLRMGYAVEAPYALAGVEGKAAGVMPELAERVARRMGVERVEWHLTEFGRLLDELEEGVFDVVAAGMFVTEARARRCVFADPVFLVRGGLLVAAGNPWGLTGYEAVAERRDVAVAVLAGAVEGPALRLAGVGAERLVELPDAISLWALWKSGRVAAVALSYPTLKWLISNEPPGAGEIVPLTADGDATEGRVAFAFRKGESVLARRWSLAQAQEMERAEFAAWSRRHGLEPAREGAR